MMKPRGRIAVVVHSPRIKLTYEDYANTPDDERYELIDGELILSPSPRTAHQRADIRLGSRLHMFVDERDLGEVFMAPIDVVLSDNDVVQPDLVFVSTEREYIITDLNIQGAPDLVVEILSPSTAERDRTVKRDLYEKHGVREYWMLDLDARTLTILLRGESGFEVHAIYSVGDTMESPTLPGFTLDLDEIF